MWLRPQTQLPVQPHDNFQPRNHWRRPGTHPYPADHTGEKSGVVSSDCLTRQEVTRHVPFSHFDRMNHIISYTTGVNKNVLSWILCAQVISAQQLPKINTDKASSIVDPQVWVEIHGVAIDNARDKTQRIDNNGTPIIHPSLSHHIMFKLGQDTSSLLSFVFLIES